MLQDGRSVAIKVQYPGIAEAVENDLDALGWIARPLGNLRSDFDLDGYRETVRLSLAEELDYGAEARNQLDLARAAKESDLDLVVPELLPELSSERVLTSRWEEGQSHLELGNWEAKTRGELGRRMLVQFLTLLFDHGLLHADPHPGNYRFRIGRSGPQVVLYDYGCVYRMQERDRLVLLRLISEAANPRSKADPFPLLVELVQQPESFGTASVRRDEVLHESTDGIHHLAHAS